MKLQNDNCDSTGFESSRASQGDRGLSGLTLMIAVVITAILLGAPRAMATSHDVEWVFGNVFSASYRLDPGTPPEIGPVGAENPTIPLELGKRYQVRVVEYLAHPLEIIAKGASFSQDVLLLRQGGNVGSFEFDPEVNWTDDGAGTVAFTMTVGLYSAMTTPGHNPGYRCLAHVSTMRGNFTVSGIPIAERIPKGDIPIELEIVVSSLAAPTDMKPFPDTSGRVAIVDQAGKIFLLSGGSLLPTPLLDVSARLVDLGILGSKDGSDYDERGLLGLAFHPDFANPARPGYRRLYTYTSEPVSGPADFTTDPPPTTVNHQSVVAEWAIDAGNPDVVNPASRREILRVDQPQFNHNGGMLAFGHDGYLHISLGDGGAGNDVGDGHGSSGNGQNEHTVHGSVLRIDPLHPAFMPGSTDPAGANGQYRIPLDNPFVGTAGTDEIFAYGFRNPFRFSFDQANGRLIVADVGQNSVEEVDIVVKGGNYGWNLKEGTFAFNPATGGVSFDTSGLPADMKDPVLQYDHDDGISVIGGYVYRGAVIPELAGKYVFGDFSRSFAPADGRLFYADLDTGRIQELRIGLDDRVLGLYVKGFGLDSAGELYVLASSNLGPFETGGVVLKIVDLCTTRFPGDVNRDCVVDFRDFTLMAGDWLASAVR